MRGQPSKWPFRLHFCQSWSNFIKSCKIIIHFTSFFKNCWPGFPNGNLSYNIYNSRPFYYVNWHCWPTFNSISSLEFLKWHCWPDSYTNLTQQISILIWHFITLYNSEYTSSSSFSLQSLLQFSLQF